MQQTYKVLWAEAKTTAAGKPFKTLSLESNGVQVSGVSIWSDNGQYANATPGGEITGMVTETPSKNGGKPFKNFKDALSQTHPLGGHKSGIKQAMAQKDQSITKFQAAKEDSIRTSSTMRDAVLLVTTFYPELATVALGERGDRVKETVTKVRKFLLDSWEPVEEVNDHGGQYEVQIDPADLPY